jgi:hypothetical protein
LNPGSNIPEPAAPAYWTPGRLRQLERYERSALLVELVTLVFIIGLGVLVAGVVVLATAACAAAAAACLGFTVGARWARRLWIAAT